MIRLARAIWYVLTLRCEEADGLRCAKSPAERTWYERLGERIHVLLCTSCRRARRQVRLLQSAIDEMKRDAGAPDRRMPDAARERIARRLRTEADADE